MSGERAGREATRALAQRIAAGAGIILSGLVAGLADLWRRPARGPVARVMSGGLLEILALTAVAAGCVAAATLVLDPLAPGLRAQLPVSVIILAERLTALGLGGVVLWPLGLALATVLLWRPTLDAMGQRVASALLARVGFLFISVAGAGLLVTVVKRVIGRARPHVALHVAGPDPQFTFHMLAWKASYASFPSGHATTVFATAVAFAALYPRARTALLGLAVVVAATRVMLGAHYPSDVLAGAAVASAFVLWMVKVFASRRLVFRVDAHGRIAPMAGPSARRLGRLLPWSSRTPTSFEEARS